MSDVAQVVVSSVPSTPSVVAIATPQSRVSVPTTPAPSTYNDGGGGGGVHPTRTPISIPVTPAAVTGAISSRRTAVTTTQNTTRSRRATPAPQSVVAGTAATPYSTPRVQHRRALPSTPATMPPIGHHRRTPAIAAAISTPRTIVPTTAVPTTAAPFEPPVLPMFDEMLPPTPTGRARNTDEMAAYLRRMYDAVERDRPDMKRSDLLRPTATPAFAGDSDDDDDDERPVQRRRRTRPPRQPTLRTVTRRRRRADTDVANATTSSTAAEVVSAEPSSTTDGTGASDPPAPSTTLVPSLTPPPTEAAAVQVTEAASAAAPVEPPTEVRADGSVGSKTKQQPLSPPENEETESVTVAAIEAVEAGSSAVEESPVSEKEEDDVAAVGVKEDANSPTQVEFAPEACPPATKEGGQQQEGASTAVNVVGRTTAPYAYVDGTNETKPLVFSVNADPADNDGSTLCLTPLRIDAFDEEYVAYRNRLPVRRVLRGIKLAPVTEACALRARPLGNDGQQYELTPTTKDLPPVPGSLHLVDDLETLERSLSFDNYDGTSWKARWSTPTPTTAAAAAMTEEGN